MKFMILVKSNPDLEARLAESLASLIQSETAKWADVVKESGTKLH